MSANEKSVDRKFTAGLKALGVTSIKLSTLGRYGVSGSPDRLVLMPKGRACFIELKAPGKKPTALQVERQKALLALGFVAATFDDAEDALRLVRALLWDATH